MKALQNTIQKQLTLFLFQLLQAVTIYNHDNRQ